MKNHFLNKKIVVLIFLILIVIISIFIFNSISIKSRSDNKSLENTANTEKTDPILKITPIKKRKHGYIITAKKPVNSDKIVIIIRIISQIKEEREAIKELAHDFLKSKQINLNNYEIFYE